VKDVLWHCHDSPYGGHFNTKCIQQKSCKHDSSGPLYLKTHLSIANNVIDAKRVVESQEDMSCHYIILLKLKSLTIEALTSWDLFHHLNLRNTSRWLWSCIKMGGRCFKKTKIKNELTQKKKLIGPKWYLTLQFHYGGT